MENPCFLVEDLNSSWPSKNNNYNSNNNQNRHNNNNEHSQNLQNTANNNNVNKARSTLRHDLHQQRGLYICPIPRSEGSQYSEKKGISIIYEPHCLGASRKADGSSSKLRKEWCPSGWRLELSDHKHSATGQKVATVFCALVLATIITLLATAAVVYILRTVHPTSIGGPKRNTWFGVVMVNGEFRITNEVYRSTLANHQTPEFQHLSSKISTELDKLFSESILSEEYHSSVVTDFAPGLIVRCWLALRPTNQLMPGKVGMAFLGGLHHQHGKVWLGNFTVDIQSIGFESKVEEIAWSNWSDWSECKILPGGRVVRVRTRSCVLQSGLHLSRADPCYLLDNHPSVDTIDCIEVNNNNNNNNSTTLSLLERLLLTEKPFLVEDSGTGDEQEQTTVQSQKVKEQTDITVENNILQLTPISVLMRDKLVNINKIQNASPEESEPAVYNFSLNEKRQCGLCVEGEVCVALKDDPVPYCLPVVDLNDPTGCGGHCKINVELCQRLQKDIYRCVDDSQCLEDEWQCSNRLCIPISKRCDGYFNCYDNTDEFDCECDLKTHFHCGNLLSCLPNKKKCDGVVDCWDAADEFNCTKDCFGSGQFTCNDSQCIPSHQFCDGFPDCLDQSDEPLGCGGECKNNEWKCRNNRCIPKSEICNGIDNCGDNSDETLCANAR